ncbi:LysR family transcriptional regulator [Phytoactinopolyspora limicola]|uniref:LysR substrate-binding domain-containing protein n=1 Tax=Phytoactinopolyspora limicola TaxID=2715536 RepID=UPI0014072377|nr:LysR family transcriptional regulator [Phytoactinopolyspora limicola]
MDLIRHLQYFAAVAHERHFGRAAQRLGIRQPPLSQGLKRLEAHLGVRLCDRDSQGVSLTTAGLKLLPAAHRVLDEVEQLRLLARRQETPSRPRIAVRVAPGLGTSHYATLVAACHRAVPDAEIDITEQSSADQVQDLLAGRAELGVLREPVVARDVTLGPHVRVTLYGLVPSGHPGAASGRVKLRDLAGYHLVLPPRVQAPAAFDEIVAVCERHGFLPESIQHVPDDRLSYGLVASGTHVGFTTDDPRRTTSHSSGVSIVTIDDEPLTLGLRLAWATDLPQPTDRLPPVIVAALTGLDVAAAGHDATAHRLPAASELPPPPLYQPPGTPRGWQE